MNGSAAAAVLCVVAGFAGSVQVAVMARLGDRVGVVEALTFATVLSAVLAAVILLVARGSLVVAAGNFELDLADRARVDSLVLEQLEQPVPIGNPRRLDLNRRR